ncbi:MAG: hypothetical protein KGY81_00810, partial [Phycisphaerae bacterium]|nr:hypothetical protein [Phycisphaerae bacterium]
MHRLPWYQLLCLSVSAWGFAACTGPGAGGPAGPRDGAAELTIEQERTYRETKQGRFLSLADFEAQGHLDGRSQAKAFNVFPPGDGRAVYTTDRARTGGGALAVTVPARRSLVFAMPASIDLGRYTLLTMALYSEAVRDDLRVTLMSL